MMIRFTPNGRVVSAWVAAISAPSWSGVMAPQASTPNPPALEMVETRVRSDTQVMAPPIKANGQPRNSVPARQSRSRRRRPGLGLVAQAASRP